MTASINRRGQLVLESGLREKIRLQEGDLFLVKRDKRGRLVLEKRSSRSKVKPFLAPPPLDASVLEKLYSDTDPLWDKTEDEAVTLGRKALAGRRLESL